MVMKELNNSLTLILLLINLFASVGIIVAALYYPESPFYVKNEDEVDKYKPLNISLTINLDKKIPKAAKNFTYFDNYKEAHYNLKESNSEDSNSSKLNYATYINFITIYMCFYLICSFFIEEVDCPYCQDNCCCNCKCNLNLYCYNFECSCEKLKQNKCFVYSFLPCFACYYCCESCSRSCIKCCGECCHDCGKCCDDCCKSGGSCSSSGSGGGGGEGMAGLCLILCAVVLVAAAIYGFFYLIYFLSKKCGKAIIRYISFFVNTLINIIIFGLAYSVIDEKEKSIYAILALSGVIFISNIIGAILSNIYEKYSWCDSNFVSLEDIKSCQTNIKNPTSDFLDYNLEVEANRDLNNPTSSKDEKTPMIEYQTYSSDDNALKKV